MKKPLVLVTAGPTREKIDPVRFISNYSTGAFGYEIAKEALRKKCSVVLVSGPTCLMPPEGVRFIQVESALGMLKAVKKEAVSADYVFMTAAVSDWRPKSYSKRKIKRRGGGNKTIKLIENPDILKMLGRNKGYCLVGFALETESLSANAAAKLKNKNLDIIVANNLRKESRPFGHDKTDIMIMDKTGAREFYKRKTKRELAKIILDKAFRFKIK